jgi:hypothetical protein
MVLITLLILSLLLLLAYLLISRFGSLGRARDERAQVRRTANVAIALSLLTLTLVIVDTVAFVSEGGVRNVLVAVSAAVATLWLWRSVWYARRHRR